MSLNPIISQQGSILNKKNVEIDNEWVMRDCSQSSELKFDQNRKTEMGCLKYNYIFISVL